MLSYPDEQSRDDAHPDPGDSKLVIYNEALGSEQFWTGKYWRTPSRDIARDLQAYPAIWVPECANDITAIDWYLFLRSRSQPTLGYSVHMTIYENVRAIKYTSVGTICPAWYLGYPANTTGTYSISNSDGYNYYNIDEGGADYVEYDVPDDVGDGYEATHVRMWVYEVADAGTLHLNKNPSGDNTEIGTLSTDGDGGIWTAMDVELSESLTAGDKLRIDSTGARARLHEVALFDGSGAKPYPPMASLLQDERDFKDAASGHEFAMRMAPTAAGALQWIGGYHQSSASLEVSPTETWKIDGVEWTPATGFHVARCGGTITLDRSSTHQYTDASYNGGAADNIGAIETLLLFGATELEAEWKYTVETGKELNLSVYYTAMTVAPTEVTNAYTNDSDQEVLPAGDESYVTVSQTNPNEAHVLTMGTIIEGDDVHLELLEQSHRLEEVWVNPGDGYKKAYFQCYAITPWAADSEAFAKWRLSYS